MLLFFFDLDFNDLRRSVSIALSESPSMMLLRIF